MPRMPKPPVHCEEHYPVSASEDIKLKILENKMVPRDLSGETVVTSPVDESLIYLYENGASKTVSVSNLLSKASGMEFKVVETLPETGQKNIIYLLKITPTGGEEYYEQWVYTDNAWLKIGSTSVDLSAYAKKTWVEEQGYLTQHQDISGKADITYVDEQLELKATKTELETAKSGLMTEISNEATARSTADTALGNRIKVYEDNKADYDDAVSKKHEHSNKELLDTVVESNLLTEAQIAEINKVANKADTDYVTTQLAKKQDKIVAGNNITIDADGKTINAIDQQIGTAFTTAVDVGNLPAGTNILATQTLRELIYQMLSKVEVTSVSLDKHTVSIDVGSSTTVTATVLPARASDPSLTWEVVSGSDYIELTGTGTTRNIKAIASGSATIQATSVSNPDKYDTCVVTCNYYPVESLTLAKHTTTIKAGNSETLTYTLLPTNATNKNVTWTSSNSSIATVSSTGIVTAKAVGNCVITIKSVDQPTITDTCTVTVEKVPVTSVTLNKSATQLVIGNSETLVATVLPTNATNKNVIWSSSDMSKVSVDQTGKVTAVAAGTANVYATSEDDGTKQAVCVVTAISIDINVKYGGAGVFADDTPFFPSGEDYAAYLDGDVQRMTATTTTEAELLSTDGYEARMTITTGTLPCEEELGEAEGQYPAVWLPLGYTVTSMKDADSKLVINFSSVSQGTGKVWFNTDTFVAKGVSKGLLIFVSKEA